MVLDNPLQIKPNPTLNPKPLNSTHGVACLAGKAFWSQSIGQGWGKWTIRGFTEFRVQGFRVRADRSDRFNAHICASVCAWRERVRLSESQRDRESSSSASSARASMCSEVYIRRFRTIDTYTISELNLHPNLYATQHHSLNHETP